MAENRDANPRRILLVLFLGVLMGALDIAIVGPALPAIRGAFAVDPRSIGWTLSVFVLLNLVGTPFMAKLSDLYGRRSVYVLDVSLFALGSLVVALSPSFLGLLVGRGIQGFGAGGIFPVASAVIGDTFPPEKRGRYLGLIGAVFGIAFLLGPVLAGVILSFASWRWLFLLNLPVAAVVLAGSRILPQARPKERPSFDVLGMTVLGVLMASLAYGINQVDASNLGASLASLQVWPFLLLAVVLVPVLRWAEHRAADPVLRLSLFESSQVGIVTALSAGSGLGEAAVVFVPDLLVVALGVSKSVASFMLVPLVLAMAVGAPLFGRLLDHYGSRVVVLVGTALLAAGLVGVGFLPAGGTMDLLGFQVSTLVVEFYAFGALVGLGLSSLVGSTLRYIMVNEAPAADRAAAQGLLTIFLSVGQLVGGVAVPAVAASQGGGLGGYRSAFLVVGVLTVALFLLGFGLKSREAEMETAARHHADAGA